MHLFKDYLFTGQQENGRREIITLHDMSETIFGIKVTVPKGSFSDGASTPKFADDLFGFDPLKTLYLRPAVFHDYLYRNQMLSRWLCDLIFLKLILKAERPLYKKLYFGIIMFTAVRLGGKKAYDSYNT